MKKFLLNVLIGIPICYLAQWYIPYWWIFAVVTFIISSVMPYSSGVRSFFGGLLIVFVAWMMLYLIQDMPNNSVMSNKMANLFSLKNNYGLFVLASLIMGLIAGLTSLSAFFLRKKK